MDEWRTITLTCISTGLFLIASLSIIISMCDRKKKKSQAQQVPGKSVTPKSAFKPAQPPSSAKNPSSPLPGEGRNKNDLQAAQNQKNALAKSKNERKSVRQASNKIFAGALDKTQEESKRSAKSNSKESGENNNNNLNKKEEQTGAKDTEKKDEEEKKSTEPPPIVPEDKVQVLGNLDDVIKEKKTQLVKEIEDMGSAHEHDKVEKEPLNPEKHVVINEKKCKLYTTNNEETKEDDAPDDLI